MPTDAEITIARRFCGPPNSGNGGYVSGRLAAYVPGVAAVRLKAPPPLAVELHVEIGAQAARLLHGSTIIAEARSHALDIEAPPALEYEEAESAARSYAGFHVHPFPTCFVCGPERAPGDGLRIFPGAVPARELVAAPWVPHTSLAEDSGRVDPAFLWAALDCTGAFVYPQAPRGRAIVLGELCARIDADVRPEQRCVAAAWPIGIDGRKRFCGSAVYSQSGVPIAVARATWIEVAAQEFTER